VFFFLSVCVLFSFCAEYLCGVRSFLLLIACGAFSFRVVGAVWIKLYFWRVRRCLVPFAREIVCEGSVVAGILPERVRTAKKLARAGAGLSLATLGCAAAEAAVFRLRGGERFSAEKPFGRRLALPLCSRLKMPAKNDLTKRGKNEKKAVRIF